MKIERLVISYNQYDWEQEGVPAKSYGAKVDVVAKNGRLVAGLYIDTVHKILEMVAPEIVQQLRDMQKDVSANSIIMQDNLLEHQAEEQENANVSQG